MQRVQVKAKDDKLMKTFAEASKLVDEDKFNNCSAKDEDIGISNGNESGAVAKLFEDIVKEENDKCLIHVLNIVYFFLSNFDFIILGLFFGILFLLRILFVNLNLIILIIIRFHLIVVDSGICPKITLNLTGKTKEKHEEITVEKSVKELGEVNSYLGSTNEKLDIVVVVLQASALMDLAFLDGGLAALFAPEPLDELAILALDEAGLDPGVLLNEQMLGLQVLLRGLLHLSLLLLRDPLGALDDDDRLAFFALSLLGFLRALFLDFHILGEVVDYVLREFVPAFELDLLYLRVVRIDLDHLRHFQLLSFAADAIRDEQLLLLLDCAEKLALVVEDLHGSLGGVESQHALHHLEQPWPLVAVGLEGCDVAGEFMPAVRERDVLVADDADVLADLTEGID